MKRQDQAVFGQSRKPRVRLLSLSVGILSVSWALLLHAEAPAAPDLFQQAAPGYQYRFPHDHGSHNQFRTEWWYYTGHVHTSGGRRFGYQLTFFRRGIDHPAARTNPSRWAIKDLYCAHFAVSDIDGNRFVYREKISRAGLGKAGAEPGVLKVWVDRWKTETVPPAHDTQRLVAAGSDYAIQLTLRPLKPPVIHGRDGVSRKGQEPNQASHYISFTRLDTRGTLTVQGIPLHVTGETWMDHEFGSADLGENIVGWDWFSIQLKDGTEFMYYVLRNADGTPSPISSGTFVQPDGTSQYLAGQDFALTVEAQWMSPTSQATYPSRWTLSVPTKGLTLHLQPVLRNQELITRNSTQVTYWEGAVDVTGTRNGTTVSGHGYVELTGYAKKGEKSDVQEKRGEG